MSKPPAGRSHATAGRNALLVETDARSVRVSRSVLEGKGFAVAIVDSGIAAVVAAREAHPDLIIIGQQLRDVSGREAACWLRSNAGLQGTPIILLTPGEPVEPRCRSAAALCKPASAASLRRTIGAFFDAARRERPAGLPAA